VTAGRYRLGIRYVGILAGKTFPEHSFKSVVPVSIHIPVQKIPAHLVYHDTNHQLWPFNTRISLLGLNGDHGAHKKNGKTDFSHVIV
jgi:hypothetical protein